MRVSATSASAAAEATDKIKIDVEGTAESPLYRVTGRITAQRRIARPRRTVQARAIWPRLRQWIDDLAARGPPDRRAAKSAFGLTAKQLQQVHDDLSKPVGFSTWA